MNKQVFYKLNVACLFVLCTVDAASNSDSLASLSLDELLSVNISTGTSIPLLQAPSAVTLITASDITASGALTLDEVLETVVGFHAVPSTLNRLKPSFAVRGIYSSNNTQLLFMLNGTRLINNLYNGGLGALASMPVKSIKRIEVVRGPGSAIYGADAFSGVVNIITHDFSAKPAVNSGMRTGQDQTQNIWANFSSINESGVQIEGAFEVFKRASSRSRVLSLDAQTDLDAQLGSNASYAPGILEDRKNVLNYSLAANLKQWQLSLDGYSYRDDGVDIGLTQALDPMGYEDYDTLQVKLDYRSMPGISNWRHALSFSVRHSDTNAHFTLFPAGANLPIGNDGNAFMAHDGEGCITQNVENLGCVTHFSEGYVGNPSGRDLIFNGEWVLKSTHFDNHDIRIALGTRRIKERTSETKNFGPGILDKDTLAGMPNPALVNGRTTNMDGTPYIYAPDSNRNVEHISAQDIWHISPSWALTSGVRYDHYSDFGDSLNPRLALVWEARGDLTTKLLYGQAFRAPTFAEMYAQNNPVATGNANLKAETIETLEWVVNYSISDTIVNQFSLYQYHSQDMVDFVFDAGQLRTVARNIGEVKGQGFEWELNWLASDNAKISFNYSNAKTLNKHTNTDMPFVPKQQLYLRGSWQFYQNWNATSQLHYIADRARDVGDARPSIKDYAVLDLNVRNQNLEHFGLADWAVSFNIKNIANAVYYEPSDGRIPLDYPMYGRRWYVSLERSF